MIGHACDLDAMKPLQNDRVEIADEVNDAGDQAADDMTFGQHVNGNNKQRNESSKMSELRLPRLKVKISNALFGAVEIFFAVLFASPKDLEQGHAKELHANGFGESLHKTRISNGVVNAGEQFACWVGKSDERKNTGDEEVEQERIEQRFTGRYRFGLTCGVDL